jgi:predicted site-specific integrase-resolvase
MFGLMKVKAFAADLGVPITTVYSWKQKGVVPSSCFINIGKSLFIKIDEMKKWLDKSESDATTVL